MTDERHNADAAARACSLVFLVSSDVQDRIAALADSWGRPIRDTMAVLIERGLRDAEAMGVCRICGCTQWDACEDPQTGETCSWAADDLCSACAKPARCKT